MGKQFYFGTAWTRNEDRAKRLQEEEGRFEGAEAAPTREVTDARGRKVRLKTDASIGVDGYDIHHSGEKVSVLKEEYDPHTDSVTLYTQNENGGTYAQRWEKIRPGLRRAAEKPRRVYGI
jgi:hypothetical protein